MHTCNLAKIYIYNYMLHSVVKYDVIYMHHIGVYIATDFLPLQLQQNRQEKA